MTDKEILQARLAGYQDRLAEIRALVDEQAKDDGLWFRAQHASEAYLQQALRKLHAVVEGKK